MGVVSGAMMGPSKHGFYDIMRLNMRGYIKGYYDLCREGSYDATHDGS